jgi:hypothetical protein
MSYRRNASGSMTNTPRTNASVPAYPSEVKSQVEQAKLDLKEIDKEIIAEIKANGGHTSARERKIEE